jgi:tetratricopeptide (TPR) repeat protein
MAAASRADEGTEPGLRVCLDRTEKFSVSRANTLSGPIWNRELLRQALLIAARSELQLPVADQAVGEAIDSEDADSLELAFMNGRPNRIELLQGAKGKRTVIWKDTFPHELPWPAMRDWVERMEVLSRGGFVEALERAKFTRRAKPKAKNVAEPLPPDLVAKIDGDLSFLEQFLALRALHESITSEGESRARLGGLIRAYAQLGLLTEHLWHPMSYAFKARAVLYAQRWVVRDTKSPLALQHRAFAFALVGMHGAALEDLEAAKKLDGAEADAPAWIPLLDAFCHYDFDRLKKLQGERELKPLASLLYFLAHEHEGSPNRIVKVGLELAPQIPGCYRVLDTLCHHTGPGVGQLTTQAGPMYLAVTLLPALTKVESLPPAAQAALEEAKKAGAVIGKESDGSDLPTEIEHRAKVIAALQAPAEKHIGRIEPEWSVLGHLIEETSFLQVYRAAYFMGKQIGLPADDYLEAYEKVTAKHRCAPFLEEFSFRRDEKKLAEAMEKFDLVDNTFALSPLWSRWPSDGYQSVGIKTSNAARSHKAPLPNEMGLAARSYEPSISLTFGSLLAISPHSPYAMAVALERRPRVPDAGETDEEKSFHEAAKKSPLLARKLAQTWQERGDRDKAERFLKLAAELDPSYENSMLLAKHYKAQGNDEKWLQALEDYLKTPNLGLQHAQVQCEIARYYCERREWEKALPYADAAGETGAQWAMSWARTVNEANQNWSVAEEHYIASIERYGESPLEWYFFCQRTGFGQLDLAAKTAFPNGPQELVTSNRIPKFQAASVLYFEGQLKPSLEVFEAEAKQKRETFLVLLAALAADRVEDVAKRDALLKMAGEKGAVPPTPTETRPYRPELAELARLLAADLAAGGKCEFDYKALHALRDRAPVMDHGGFNYFIGCYLDLRGKTDQAIEYWKLCMAGPGLVSLGSASRTGAGFELQKRGVKPSDWKPLLFAKQAGK